MFESYLASRLKLLEHCRRAIDILYPDSPRRLKRQRAQDAIFQLLKIRRNNRSCVFLNEAFQMKGYRLVKIRGHLYYRR